MPLLRPFSPFYSVQEPSPWDGATHIQGRSPSIKPLWKHAHRQALKSVPIEIFSPITLVMNTNHHALTCREEGTVCVSYFVLT